MRLLTIDPGGSSGLCFAETSNVDAGHRVFSRVQLHEQHHKQLWSILNLFAPHKVISEQFNFRQSKRKIVLDSVEYIGVCKLWCQVNNIKYDDQSVMSGKASSENVFWNDEKLKAIGLHLPGQVHANDATAHMLYYITFTLNEKHYLKQYTDNKELA